MSAAQAIALPDVDVRAATASVLLAQLCELQHAIRLADFPADQGLAASPYDPILISLLRQERRIVHEIRRREALLTEGIRWQPVMPPGGRTVAAGPELGSPQREMW